MNEEKQKQNAHAVLHWILILNLQSLDCLQMYVFVPYVRVYYYYFLILSENKNQCLQQKKS